MFIEELNQNLVAQTSESYLLVTKKSLKYSFIIGLSLLLVNLQVNKPKLDNIYIYIYAIKLIFSPAWWHT